MTQQLQGSINPEARSQAAGELGVGQGSDLRLAMARAGQVCMLVDTMGSWGWE